MGSFMCIGYFSPTHGTDGLKSPPKDNEDKAPCPRALLPGRGSNRGPPVWKSEALTARPRQLLDIYISSRGCFPVKSPNHFIAEAPSNPLLNLPFKNMLQNIDFAVLKEFQSFILRTILRQNLRKSLEYHP